MTPAEVLELARKHGDIVPPQRTETYNLDEHQLSALIAEVEARTLERAAVEQFTREQRVDLFTAALYLHARDDDTVTLEGSEADRIAEFLCDLSGIDLDAALKPGQGADSQGGRG